MYTSFCFLVIRELITLESSVLLVGITSLLLSTPNQHAAIKTKASLSPMGSAGLPLSPSPFWATSSLTYRLFLSNKKADPDVTISKSAYVPAACLRSEGSPSGHLQT